MSHVKIQMTGPQTGKVWVDGQEMPQVVAVTFKVDASDMDGIAYVEIVQRVYGDIEIDGQMDVTVLSNLGSRQYAKADG